MMRVVLRVRKNARIVESFKKLRWLTVWQTRQYHDIIQLNTMLTTKTPLSISEKFIKEKRHDHDTRASRNPHSTVDNPKITSQNSVKQKGFVCRAAKLYSNLPPILINSHPPRHVFKDTVRCNIGGFEQKERTFNYWLNQVCLNKAQWGEWL